MKNRFNHKQLLTPFLCLVLSIPGFAFAVVNKDKAEVESMKITFPDLDLSQDEGVVTLYQRLKSNVGKVCGEKDTHVIGSRIAASKIKKEYKKCTALALNNAVKSIDNEKLTKLHTKANS
ncbi:MAG: UrcA family protein [Planctomycetota bacterium]|jgi:UrcA family protein